MSPYTPIRDKGVRNDGYIDEAIFILVPLFKCQDIRAKLVALGALAGEVVFRLP